jgi:plastocyanin
MSRRVSRAVGSSVLAAAVALLAASGSAGPEKIVFPSNFKAGVLYTIADRYDVKQYRELYASPEAIQAAKDGKPLPQGTILTLIQYKAQVDAQGNLLKDAKGRFLKGDLIGYAVMEKRAGWGAEYPDDLRNGEWEYAAFTVDGKLNDKANYKGCFQCHKPHDRQDFVISYPALAGRTAVAGTAPAAAAGPRVTITGFVFGPAKLSVKAGQPVTWDNGDDSPHMIAVTGKPLKTGILLKGQSEALTFADAGTFDYTCALHPNMKGSVEVTP